MQVYYLVVKYASHSINLFRILKDKGYKVKIVSTPCSISYGCSRSVVVSINDIEEIKKIIKNNNILISNIYVKNYNGSSFRYIKID